jgi:hypothetical protein
LPFFLDSGFKEILIILSGFFLDAKLYKAPILHFLPSANCIFVFLRPILYLPLNYLYHIPHIYQKNFFVWIPEKEQLNKIYTETDRIPLPIGLQ